MEELLSKPWWQFIGVITGVVLSLIAIFVSIRQNRKKNLVYYVPYLYPLVNINENVKSDFEIKYKGEKIDQVCISEIVIENTGQVPIKKEDYEEAIKIEIENCKHIFNVELVDTFLENLVVNLDINSNSNYININPLLLNQKDLIRLKIIFEGEKATIKVSSRIVDLQHIQVKKESRNYKNAVYGSIIVSIGIFLSLLLPAIAVLGAIFIGIGIQLGLEIFSDHVKKYLNKAK